MPELSSIQRALLLTLTTILIMCMALGSYYALLSKSKSKQLVQMQIELQPTVYPPTLTSDEARENLKQAENAATSILKHRLMGVQVNNRSTVIGININPVREKRGAVLVCVDSTRRLAARIFESTTLERMEARCFMNFTGVQGNPKLDTAMSLSVTRVVANQADGLKQTPQKFAGMLLDHETNGVVYINPTLATAFAAFSREP